MHANILSSKVVLEIMITKLLAINITTNTSYHDIVAIEYRIHGDQTGE